MIRLLGTLTFVCAIALAACGGDDDDGNSNDAANGGNCKEIGANIVTGENAVPPVEGEERTTESCLKIIDVVVGDGDEAPEGGTVTVHYTGYLEDGTVFDSSVARQQPFATSLDRVIQGWGEGIPGMRIGGQRRLIIPSGLAYGENGYPPAIPPNATLIFDVELLEIFQ